jgi:O-antigen/teichoic acid export membrane protein
MLMAVSYVVYLGLAFTLVPLRGLEGLLIAQIIQSVGLMAAMWWILRLQLKTLPMLPARWRLSVLKGMFAYGASFQVISLIGVLFDPAINALMGRFGGVRALGYYGMANSLILQGRAVIVEGSRVIVPSVASVYDQQDGSSKTRELFVASYRLTFYVSALFYGLLGTSITAISMLWLDHYQPVFIQFALLLVMGWFVNTIAVPAYFSNLGTGRLRDNVVCQLIIIVSACVLGVALGRPLGGVGVVLGLIVALLAGGVFLLQSHTRKVGVSLSTLAVPRDMVGLLMLTVLVTLISNSLANEQSSVVTALGACLLSIMLLLALAWLSPARRTLLRKSEAGV